MPFNQQELDIIKWGAANGKSKDEVTQAITNLRSGITPGKKSITEQPTGYLERLAQGYSELGGRVSSAVEKGAQEYAQGVQEAQTAPTLMGKAKGELQATLGLGRAGLRTAGAVAEGAITPIVEAPIVKDALSWIGTQVGQTEAGKKLAEVMKKNPEVFQDIIDAVNLLTLGAGKTVEKPIQEGLSTVSKTAEQIAKENAGNILKSTEEFKKTISPAMMNNVARLNPSDIKAFAKYSGGRTPGEYLVDTGNFGAPDKIIANEAQKFASTLADKEATLAKLPGLYQNGSISDALDAIIKRGEEVSSPNVKAPFLDEALKLKNKLETDGLTMSEINQVKKSLERNVKISYNKITEGAKVAQATNIDSALAKFQDQTAKELGFTNIRDLSNQIQLSKFLIDKLGDEVVGKSALNYNSLTDWIVLSGGDPTAVGAFLTKKFFSDKAVRAKIAEILNSKEITPPVKAMLEETQAFTERKVSPKGLKQLKAPTDKTFRSKLESGPTINMPSRKAIEQGTEIVPRTTPEAPTKQPILKKESQSYKEVLPKTAKKSIDDTLITKAKKYKSAEEFVKAQNKTATGAKVPDTLKIYSLEDKDLGKIYRQSGIKSSSYPADFMAKNDIPELGIKKGDKVSILANDKDAKRFIIENIPERKTESGAYSKSAQIGDLVDGYSRQDQIDFINKNFSKESLTKSQLEDIWKKANKSKK